MCLLFLHYCVSDVIYFTVLHKSIYIKGGVGVVQYDKPVKISRVSAVCC